MNGERVAGVYASCADRIAALAAGLSQDELKRKVPGTPLWSVQDLLAHLVGGPCDVLAGNFDGIATPPWTQAQVEARRGHSVSRLLDEWSGEREAIDGLFRSGQAPALAMDIVTHEQDIDGALSAASKQDDAALDFAANGFAGRAVKVCGEAGLPLQITDDDGWGVGDSGGATLIASKRDVIRALAGRRSSRQVAAMNWVGDPTSYLDLLSPFGPLGDTDISD